MMAHADVKAPQAWLSGVLARDPVAVRAFLQEHQGRVFGAIYHLVLDAHLAQDLAQDVFVTALEKLPTLAAPEQVGGWLRQIARNRALQYLRSPQARELAMETPPAAADPQPLALAKLAQAELHRLVHRAVGRLPDELAHAIERYYIADESVATIAHALGKSENAVNILLCRARQILFDQLERYYRE